MRLDLYQAETARVVMTFKALVSHDLIEPADLPSWNAIVGLRNRIVHDYMNVDMDQVIALIADDKEQFVVRFLVTEFPTYDLIWARSSDL